MMKNYKKIFFIVLSLAILSWAGIYTNCGSNLDESSQIETSDSNTKNLTKENAESFCSDLSTCAKKISQWAKPYLPTTLAFTRVTKTRNAVIAKALPPSPVVTAASAVYVTDFNNFRVQKFNLNGNFLMMYGWDVQSAMSQFQICTANCKSGKGGGGLGQFETPEGITVDPSGNVYVSDVSNARISKFDANGNFLFMWGGIGNGNGLFQFVEDVNADPNGNIYTVDSSLHLVQKFDSNGNFILQWGGLTGNKALISPNAVTTDSLGYVYVADVVWVKKFDSNGNFILQWGSGGTGNGQFKSPNGIASDSLNQIYVTDYKLHRVQKFDSNGNYITQWGSLGTGNGQFNGPIGLALDGANNVYVSDYKNHRIQKFDSNGNYITQWGSLGPAEGQFVFPHSVAISPADKPDLVVDSISLPTTTISVGATTDNPYYPPMGYPINPATPVQVDVTIKNIGNDNAIIPANMSIALVITCPITSACNFPPGMGVNLSGIKFVPIGTAMTLAPGGTYTIHTDSFFTYHPVTVPISGTTTYTGSMWLSAVVDTQDAYLLNNNLVPESNETNNWQASPVLPITVVP